MDKRLINGIAGAYAILKSDGDCAKFFGPDALNALEHFLNKAKPASISDNGALNYTVGIRMTNPMTPSVDKDRLALYRDFERIEVNTNGPFLNPFSRASTRDFGDYNHGSLATQILQVLHEVGHMTYKDAAIVLPNDGGNSELSAQNTTEVLKHCRNEIDRLVKTLE